MNETATETGQRIVLDPTGLDALCASMSAQGYTLLGSRVRDGAIVLDEIVGRSDLPRGIGDEQSPGRYRLRERNDEVLVPASAKARIDLQGRGPAARERMVWL